MKKLQILSVLSLLTLSACFKQEGDLLLVLPQGDLHPLGVTFYPPNSREVVAQRVDADKNIIWLFGRYEASGGLTGAAAASFIPAEGNLQFHFIFDDQGRLSYLYAAQSSGERLGELIRFQYPASERCDLSLYTTDWIDDYRLEWKVTIVKASGLALPVYIRDECGTVQTAAFNIQEGLALIENATKAPGISLPVWMDDALSGPLSLAATLLDNACETELRQATSPPPASIVPDNPGRLTEGLAENTGVQPCSENPPLDFKVLRDVNGNITFSETTGGKSPFTYSFDGSDFQANPVFEGPFPAGESYLLMIRDADGCVLAKVEKPIPAPPQKGILRKISVQTGAEQFDIGIDYDIRERIEKISLDDSLIMEYLYTDDRLTQVVSYDKNTPADKSFENYTYNNMGRLIQVRRERSNTTKEVFRCSYDELGRLVRYERSDNNFEENEEELFAYIFEYNSAGNLKTLRRVIRESNSIKRFSRSNFTYSDAVNPLDVVGVYLEPLHRLAGHLEPLVAIGWFSANAVRQTLVIQSDGAIEAQYGFDYRYDSQSRLSGITRTKKSEGGVMEMVVLEMVY